MVSGRGHGVSFGGGVSSELERIMDGLDGAAGGDCAGRWVDRN
jgi:hypothetical protein